MMRPRLEKDELSRLYIRDDVRSGLHVVKIYFGIILLFISYFHFQSIYTFVLAFLLVGGFQHQLSIIQHEANHFLLFKSRYWNECIGALSAHATGFSMAYRRLHLQHHQTLGSYMDPDLPNYLGYPMTLQSFLIELCMHLSGIKAVLQFMNQSVTAEEKESDSIWNVVGIAVVQFAILGLFTVTGHWEHYFLLWLLPLVTLAKTLTYLRNVVEHTQCRDKGDPELSRYRTILCGPIESFFFAPMNFNFHAEHHFYPGIPYYNLSEAYHLLSKHEAYRSAVDVDHGYVRFLLKKAVQW